MNLMQKSTLISAFLLIIFLSLSAVSSATFNNTSTTNDLQNFINTNTIDNELFLDGNFNNLSTLQINRPMKISGINNAIIAKNSSSSSTILFNITTVNVTIENLIIRGYDKGIESNKGNLTIANNNINSVKTAINIENSTELKKIIIINNKITVTGYSADGIYLYSIGGIIANNSFYNNSILTNGEGTNGIFLTSYSGIVNNTFYNNSISTNGSYGNGVYFYCSNGFVENNSFYTNFISTNKDDAHGIYLASNRGLINNSFYNNFISTNRVYGYGVYLISDYDGVVENNSFYNNFISTNKDYAYGILLEGKSIFGNNLFNNSISTNGTYAYGIYLYSYDILGKDSIVDNSIVGNNIMVNSTGINVDGNTISSLNVSYNRILAKDVFINLTKMDNSNRFFANWLGNNTPDMNKIINIIMTSFYIVNATLIKNTGSIGENWTINYTFYLNGTVDCGEYWKLPLVMTQLINKTNKIDERIAHNTGLWNILIKNVISDTFTIVLDNQIIPLGTFTSYKKDTTLTIETKGQASFNRTIEIIGTLKDIEGNVLVSKLVNLLVNGKILGSQYTDNTGKVVFNYTFNKIGNYDFQIAFAEDQYFNSAKSEVKSLIIKKTDTNLELSVVGDIKVNKTITLIAKLFYNPGIAGEEIIFNLNGKLLGVAITNSEGIATIDYTIANSDIYSFSAEYLGNDNFAPSSTNLNIFVKEEPTPTPSSDPEPSPVPPTPMPELDDDNNNEVDNENTNNTAGKVGMKETGMPIIIILILLICSFGSISRKK